MHSTRSSLLLSRVLTSVCLAFCLSFCVGAVAQRGPGGPPGGGPGGMPGGGGPGGAMGSPGMGNPNSMPGNGNGNMGNRGPGGPSMGAPPRNAPQLGPPGRWWDDKKVAKSLSLRNDQQRKMDDIFNAGKGNLLQLYSNLQREESRLGSMSNADLADEGKVFASIDRVAQARADLEKANAHILLQIRKELDAQQLTALDKEIASLR